MLLACGSALAQPASFSEPQLLIKASTQGYMAPVWSPDGSRIAVTGDNFIGIYVANADGTNLRQVSQATGAGYQMTWADNDVITSTPYQLDNDRRMTRIEAVHVSSGAIEQIAAAERNFKRSRVARGGSSVLAIMLDDALNATTRIPALSAYAGRMVLNPALSPDASRIAFQIVGKGLFVCNADGTNLIALGKGSHPTWTPDSRNLLVTRIEDNGERFTSSDIFFLNLANGSATCITPDTDVIPVTMALSPDGSKLAFDNDVDGSIYVIDLK